MTYPLPPSSSSRILVTWITARCIASLVSSLQIRCRTRFLRGIELGARYKSHSWSKCASAGYAGESLILGQ
ncbi:hypothetical protein JB92DRAFT_3003436 [Gautieria morchelliformis]|nr:hypothetical protein JB92DRAFT_3003436 [Gautieria morchelliformis]